MATSAVSLSIEDYLRTAYKPDVDYVDGEIQERNVGKIDHSTIQSAMVGFFWLRRTQWGILPLTEQRIRVAETRVRIADLAVIRADDPREEVTIQPPLICVEILSPEDRMSRAKIVLSDYVAMGVQNVWLIDPLRRAAFTFDAAGLHDADPFKLAVADSPIYLDLTEAFAAID
jgi:Uma2 family endonuclease